MDFLPEEFDEILNIFRSETEEIIQKMNNNLLQLETNPNKEELLVYLFRDAHSLKGAARMIGFNNIQRLAHKAEDVLGLAKERKITISREISDALYKSIDLLSVLIQESVKIKKEYYTDDIQKNIDEIDRLITSPQNNTNIGNITFTNSNKNSKTFDLKKFSTSVNAMISEIFLLLANFDKDNTSDYIETLYYLLKRLYEKFEPTSYFEIKNRVKDLQEKLEFVMKNSNILTKEEQEEIEQALSFIANQLNEIYKNGGLDCFDYKIAINEKLKTVEIVDDKSVSQNNTNDNDSIIKIFAEKCDFVKEGLNALENNLSQIPEVKNSIDELIYISKNKEAIDIAKKLQEILEIIRNSSKLPEKEVITSLKQSLFSFEKMTFEKKEDTEDVTLILQRLDIIKQMLDLNSSVNPLSNLSATLDETSLPVKKAQDFFNSFETTSIKTLRVESKKLDQLVNQIGELIIGRIKNKKNTSELESLLQDLSEWKNFNNKSQNFIKYYDRKYLNNIQEMDYKALSLFGKQIFSIFQENSSKIVKFNNKIINLLKAINEEDTKQNLLITQLEDMVKNIRVLPLATIFHMFPRMIRDISRDTGKDIELLISGSETSADKKVIEEIKAPLMHIIRNSIDHGIETPQERIEAGKSPKGKIYLIAKSLQNKIIIEIHDDGRGIDLQKIIDRAIEKNLITSKEAEYLSAEQVMNIIFWPGFSTEQVVTEISGRGVGLDIVQTKITQLNGTVKVYSILGQGTKITIELPISMSTLKAFIVKTSGQIFALPMQSIKNVMWIKKDDIYIRNENKSLIIDGKTINVFHLSEIMGLEHKVEIEDDTRYTVLLLEVENSLMGLVVDKIMGDEDILQKKLEPPIMKLRYISGITTLANGEVCFILNLTELYKNTYTPIEKPLMINKKYKTIAKPNEEYRILIVDDSMTTRELLKNILNHWGYKYEMANNPKEGFEKLYKHDFDLILTDLEMPEMDGKIFIEKLKAHPKFKEIPIVVISSYDSTTLAEDISLADAYIKKSNFNQDYLLDVLEKILKYD